MTFLRLLILSNLVENIEECCSLLLNPKGTQPGGKTAYAVVNFEHILLLCLFLLWKVPSLPDGMNTLGKDVGKKFLYSHNVIWVGLLLRILNDGLYYFFFIFHGGNTVMYTMYMKIFQSK